jgi:hypothetical protein
MASNKRRGRPPGAPHVDSLVANLKEVRRLVEIHGAVAGVTRGGKHNVEVLNKSAIVLLVACWESFVEDLAEVAFALLLRRAKEPSAFPSKVLTLASKRLRSDNDERRVWELAGDGWKTVLRQYQGRVLQRYMGTLNTPKPDKIDDLFRDLLGIPAVSRSWSWHLCRPAKARARLNRLVTLRGAISHRVTAPRAVQKRDVVAAIALVERLATTTHNAVDRALKARLGFNPWGPVEYGAG